MQPVSFDECYCLLVKLRICKNCLLIFLVIPALVAVKKVRKVAMLGQVDLYPIVGLLDDREFIQTILNEGIASSSNILVLYYYYEMTIGLAGDGRSRKMCARCMHGR